VFYISKVYSSSEIVIEIHWMDTMLHIDIFSSNCIISFRDNICPGIQVILSSLRFLRIYVLRYMFFSFSLLPLNLYIICFSHYFSFTLIIMSCIHWFLRSLIFYLIYPSLCLWIITGNMYHRWLRWVFNSRRRCKTGIKPSKRLHINVLEVISLHQDNFHPIIFAWVD